MVSVTVITGRGSQVLLLQQRFSMNAERVPIELIGGNAVRLHAHAVGMAPGACRGKVYRIHQRPRIVDGAYRVTAVTACAFCDLHVPRLVLYAMHARPVLLALVNR